MGFSDFLKKLFGSKAERDVKRIQPIVDQINECFEQYKTYSNDQLREETQKLKALIQERIAEKQQQIVDLKETIENEEDIDKKEALYKEVDEIEKQITNDMEEVLTEILPQAFAIVKDTARRFTENDELEVTASDFDRQLAVTKPNISIRGNSAFYKNRWLAGGNEIKWEMIHYDVQLIGGIVLHEGKISEMATGEGKTLVATLPVFLNALSGRGVHLVTVNDYLARRDSEWMGMLYQFHGLSVDCIDNHDPNSEERRAAYAADITFGTNNEFGFDYLRDNMCQAPEELVQRKHNFAIVDEVDSVLIDDARTPLIISGPVPKGENQLFDELKPKIASLVNEQRKLTSQILIDAKKMISMGENEKGGILLLRAFKGLPKNRAIIKFLSEQGMKQLLQKTEDTYMAENNKRMHEITDDLFFVITERDNSIELTEKGIELISKDLNEADFFVLPDIGAKIVDIDKEVGEPEEKIAKKDKLLSDYAIKSERVHTIQQLLKAYTLFEKDVEYVVMDNKVKIVDEQTGRILDGRRYSDGLHQAIEAKESVKVEAATQTFATITLQNYFRMYNKLAGMTGTAETEAGEFWDIYKLDVVVIPTNKNCIRKDEQDKVYKTLREKYNAVIDEVAALVEIGRPVLVGTTSVEISELLSRMLKLRGIKHNVLNAKLHQKEADIVAEAGKSKTVTIATNMAGRGTDIKLSKEVQDMGGLAIIGTERHESRRVDRQLRGRAGRQGDPGSSVFFVSLEDGLMRMFGSDRIAKIMDRIGIQEGEVIQHSMITKSIERAQRKVEENNFGIRKRLLEYDNEMNKQREVIYTKRRHALFGERLQVDVINTIYDTCGSIVDEHYNKSSYLDFSIDVMKTFGIEVPFDDKSFAKLTADDITESLYEKVVQSNKRKSEEMAKHSLPVITDVYINEGHKYEQIVIPVSDGFRVYPIVVDLKKAYDNQAKEVVTAFEKNIVLRTIDEAWKEHLREMDDLRHSVQNATYEQKDPLLIYKLESFDMFQKMMDKINREVISHLLKGQIHFEREKPVQEAKQVKTDMRRLQTKREFESDRQSSPSHINPNNTQEEKVETFVRQDKKVGRNELCPCGSGKKYKNCHGKDDL